MSLFSGPEEHAANPPESWQAVKVAAGCWHLTTAAGVALGGSYKTRKAVEADKTSGFFVNLYRQEARWYAGEAVTGWKPYADVVAARERNAAHWAGRPAG